MAAYVPPHRRKAAAAGASSAAPSFASKVFAETAVVNLRRRPDRLERFSKFFAGVVVSFVAGATRRRRSAARALGGGADAWSSTVPFF
jgi:hypothetical protein